MPQSTPDTIILYGGESIEVFDYGDDKVLIFKDRKILLSQLKQFKERDDFLSNRMMIGIDKDNRVPISESHNGNIKIGCIEDTKEIFNKHFKKLSNEKK